MVIAYLYGDLLNLYGNDGNIKILTQKLAEAGVEAEVRYLSVGDKLDFTEYDVVYMGSGTEENQKIAIEALSPYKDEIKAAIDGGKLFLMTGNSLDIFGQKLDGADVVEDVEGLGVFDYHCKDEPEILTLNARKYGKHSIAGDLMKSEEARQAVLDYIGADPEG